MGFSPSAAPPGHGHGPRPLLLPCPGAAARVSPAHPEHETCPRSTDPLPGSCRAMAEPGPAPRAVPGAGGPCQGRLGTGAGAALPRPVPAPSWSDRLGADGKGEASGGSGMRSPYLWLPARLGREQLSRVCLSLAVTHPLGGASLAWLQVNQVAGTSKRAQGDPPAAPAHLGRQRRVETSWVPAWPPEPESDPRAARHLPGPPVR